MVMRSIFLLACFCLMLVGLHAWSLWISRQGELEDSATSTKNMARALASHAERSLKVADAVLAEIVERVDQDGPDYFDIERMRSPMQKFRSCLYMAPMVCGWQRRCRLCCLVVIWTANFFVTIGHILTCVCLLGNQFEVAQVAS
jgi:hypothetical protein